MFNKLIKTAIATTALVTIMAVPAMAEGGGNANDSQNIFARSVHADGTVITRRGRNITTRKGKSVRVHRAHKGGRGRGRGRRKNASWAHNHTTGVTSLGIAPGVHAVFGPFGFSFSFSD